MIKSKERGQSLIEVVVALSVAAIIITSLLIVVINSLRNAQFASNQVRSTKLASQAIEQIRSIRDRDGLTIFRTSSGTTSQFSDLWGIQMSQACSPNPCTFRVTPNFTLEQTNQASETDSLGDGLSREVIISDTASSYQTEKTVTVKVRWTDSAGPHESHLQTVISSFGSFVSSGVSSGAASGGPVIIQPTPTPNLFPAGAVAYWKMDEENGTAVNDSINSNNGTAGNGASIVDGKIRRARRFNGANQYILFGNRPSLQLQTFSIAAWVYKESSNTHDGIYSYAGVNDGGPVFYTNTSGNLELAKAGYAVCTSTTALANNNWYFVAVTYDRSSCRFYIRINNLSYDSVQSFNHTFSYSSAAYIGSHGSDGTFFHGTIDELGIWSRILTLQEINDLYNGGSGRQP